ncbi:Ras-related protein Rab-4A [Tritrichomonas foetus]|uniref:Ras-related protein Rab-4A n=1 Tax=Tritrichomonas foetus TaxID=1144522 RepID=A0A1J4JBC7_9EUKA|nr:Ras-related protein Rab-4A [Tritrichomonas foetus]|eukprot:OHS96498.1 Ras-related protein Rab-4A [Tritrichomonas foetus]
MNEDNLKFKFIILGDAGVGKSCMISHLKDGKFSAMSDSTIGVTFSNHLLHVGSVPITLQIWDTAGQEIYRSVTKSYFRDSHCAIIVYDISNPQTFLGLKRWLEDVKENCPSDCKIAIVGNKDDLGSDRQVSQAAAESFAEENEIDFFNEVSALSGHNIKNMFEECAMLVFTEAANSKKFRMIGKYSGSTEESVELEPPKRGCCS